MALYLISRPRGAEQLRNPAALHGALVDAADATAAIAAANALATGLNNPFTGYTATLVAATAQGGFVPALIEGEVTGTAYGVRRGT
jgi:hypothetical protein